MDFRRLISHFLLGLLALCCSGATVFGETRLDPRIVVILQGTALFVETSVPDIDGDGNDDPALCLNVDLVDAVTNRVIGSADDCISMADLDGTGLKAVGTTYFHFPQGTLVARGKYTLQPVQWDPLLNPDLDPNVAVITGSIPAPGVNNILSGTSRFAGARGSVRLSGAAKPAPDGLSATLNCIFVIDLYKPGH